MNPPAARLPENPQFIRLERAGPVLKVWLNRPEARNALVAGMTDELRDTFEALRALPEIRVVVLRGAGGTFCAGGDIKNFSAVSRPLEPGEPDDIALSNRRGGALFQLIDEARQAVIVAVEGFAMGGGFGMACLGDVTLATKDAQFAMTEVMIGIAPAQISPFVLRRVGFAAARRFAVSGARLNGEQARAVGVVSEVAEDAAALDAQIEKEIAQCLKCAPEAVAATKALMHRAARTAIAMDELLDLAAQDFSRLLRGPEGKEGASAFVEKRKPAWARS